MNNIYLDYAASSQKHFDIFRDVITLLEENYANPSSNHKLGKFNNKLLTNSKLSIAENLNVNADEIIFTSGGTEANNMVFNHIANNFENGEIIISDIEHPSVKESAEKLEKLGFKILTLPTSSDGIIKLEKLNKLISNNTILISIMLANNETGVIQPIAEVVKLAKQHNILVHSDIVQALGKIEIDLDKIGVDFASASAHKIGATNNFGFLYTKDNNMTPLIVGGGQEKGLRSGTSDVFGAVVFQKCLERSINNIKDLQKKKDYFLNSLNANNINFEINGTQQNSLPNIINLYFKNIQAQRLITYLDVNNIYISGGSACSSGNIKGSKIISNMFDENRAEHSVRISIGFDTTQEMIDFTINKIKQLETNILSRGI